VASQAPDAGAALATTLNATLSFQPLADRPSGRPIMLVGPSGVGKTETALALAEALYGGEQNMITINMSEFQEAHTVSLLKGAPPGYVGYGEGGVLTNAVNAIKPYTNSILAFFIMDEPDCVAGGDPNTLNALLTSIEAEIAKVKTNFPGAKTMFTVGCGFWNYSNFRIPDGMDYIAIESYGSTGDPATTKSEWLAKLNHLKSYMNGAQRIFLMPGATEGYGTESQLIKKGNDIYNYAQTDPLVIGVFPFDWYSDTYDCARVGQFCGNGVPATNYFIPVIGRRSVRDLPNLRARYIQIGQSIMNGPFLDVGAGARSMQFLGGPSLPTAPWIHSQAGGTDGITLVVNFFDSELGATNQALRINSGSNANENGSDFCASGSPDRPTRWCST
jgi:DNA polymerase III delta prime subunit